jgi:threonine synthase
MQKQLTREGIWVEPASAAGLAGLAAELRAGTMNVKGRRVVAVCTGHGLKDPDIITRNLPPVKAVPLQVEALEQAILAGL